MEIKYFSPTGVNVTCRLLRLKSFKFLERLYLVTDSRRSDKELFSCKCEALMPSSRLKDFDRVEWGQVSDSLSVMLNLIHQFAEN